MKNNNQSQDYLRKRKMLLLFPLMVLPFLTMAFWSLGGGKSKTPHQTTSNAGLNLQLPAAKLRENKSEDKLSFYEQAEKDSLKLVERIKNDPYFKMEENQKSGFTADKLFTANSNTPAVKEGLNPSLSPVGKEAPEQSLMKKLEQLNQIVNQSSNKVAGQKENENTNGKTPEFMVERDQSMEMAQAPGKTNGEDPELTQIDHTLDKILDIQHPERVKERTKNSTNKPAIKYNSPSNDLHADNDYLQTKFGNGSAKQSNQFYGLKTESTKDEPSNDIVAVTDQLQELGSGRTIQLRLLSEVHLANNVIPQNTLVYGLTRLENDRLIVDIENIRFGNRLVPVRFSAFDMDGIEGIHIPGSVSQDAAKLTFDRTIQSVDLNSLDPSLKMQAASAGINMAKNVFSKKTRQVHLTIKPGYRVFLKNKND